MLGAHLPGVEGAEVLGLWEEHWPTERYAQRKGVPWLIGSLVVLQGGIMGLGIEHCHWAHQELFKSLCRLARNSREATLLIGPDFFVFH